LLLIAALSASATATSWYVDSTVSSSGTGTSWSTAWKTFNDIQWSSIKPGDTIYISGGTYHETLTVGASGSAGKPITITKGTDAGHKGQVIIQGSGSGVGIYIPDQSWIIVKDLTLNNWASNVNIDGGSAGSAHNIILDNLDGSMSAGRFIRMEGWPDKTGSYLHDVTVRNSDVTTPNNVAAQTDFVYAQYMAGLTVENNHVIISNEDSGGHDDMVQTFWVDGPVIVRNNYFEHADHKTRNSQGIFFENYKGIFEVYNNVIIQHNGNIDAKIYFKSSTLNAAHTIIVGNSVYGS